MNLTKDMAECLLTGAEEAALPIEMPMSKDICKDWLAMRKRMKTLESALDWALPFTLFSVSCGAECPACRAKKLLDGLKPRKWETK